MRTNYFRDHILIQQKTATQGATGQTVTWKPVQARYGRKIPLDARAVAQYQQLNTVVTHKMVFEGGVSLELATNRFMHGGHTYTPDGPAQSLENNTVIMVKES